MLREKLEILKYPDDWYRSVHAPSIISCNTVLDIYLLPVLGSVFSKNESRRKHNNLLLLSNKLIVTIFRYLL